MQDTVSDSSTGGKKRGRKPKARVGIDLEKTARAMKRAGLLPASEPAVPSPDVTPAPFLLPPPAPERKIAVLGSAASSVGLAPFDDPTWEIWACSPANKALPRVDVWFELHNPEVKKREGLTEWLDWLKEQPLVYMQKPYEGYKGVREYPLVPIIKKWGPYWWTSQLTYMLALALEQNPSAIGIWGVDMAANSEYNQQRLACQYFIQHILRNTDIKLAVPPEADITEPAPMYGYCESSRRWRKYAARKLELQGRISNIQAEVTKKAEEAKHLVGALDDMEYHLAHWANTMDFE